MDVQRFDQDGDFLYAAGARCLLVRRFANCIVWSRAFVARWEILLHDPRAASTTICTYDSLEEWQEDLAYLVNLPPGGPAAAGMPAAPIRPAPTLYSQATKAANLGADGSPRGKMGPA